MCCALEILIFVGQDYIRCETPNGGYIEFDDYSESADLTAEYSYQVGKCIAYGGTISTQYTSDAIVAPPFIARQNVFV